MTIKIDKIKRFFMQISNKKILHKKFFCLINEKIFIDTKRNSVYSKSGQNEYF